MSRSISVNQSRNGIESDSWKGDDPFDFSLLLEKFETPKMKASINSDTLLFFTKFCRFGFLNCRKCRFRTENYRWYQSCYAMNMNRPRLERSFRPSIWLVVFTITQIWYIQQLSDLKRFYLFNYNRLKKSFTNYKTIVDSQCDNHIFCDIFFYWL